MTDRTVKVILRSDTSNLVSGMKDAEKATESFAANAKKSAATNGAAWTQTGQTMMVAGGALVAGVGLAVKAFADFDASMSEAQAGTMATGSSLDALRAAAIKAGADTQFSATEAANAITAMGKAGVSTKDILGGGLNGALSLAAAGQLDVGRAAEIAATAMVQFGLAGKDIPHIADLLAAGAGKAMGSVDELAGALKYAGVVASAAGWSIEETTGVLAEFAQAGIIGEQAGTSLRGVIMSMSAPSKIAAKAMESLGINMYDANGAFLKASPLAQELKNKLGPLDEATRNQALGQIFGNEQMTAAQVLYKGGGAAVDTWTESVNDAGFAAKQAAMLTDNLKGDVERLGGSLSSVLIQSGSGANGMLRTMTQQLQGAVDLYGSAPVPIQQTALAIGAVGGGVLLLSGGLLVLAPRIAETKAALAGMGRTGALMSKGLSGVGSMLMGPVGIGLAVGTLALGYYAQQAQESSARVDELATSLDQQTGAVTENTVAWVNKKLVDDGTMASAKKMGIAVGDVTAAAMGNTEAMTRVNAALEAYIAANGRVGNTRPGFDQAKADALNLSAALGINNDELTRGVEKTKLLAEANAGGAAAAAAAIDPVTGLTGAETDLGKAADDAKKAHDDLKAAIEGFGSVTLDARGKAREYGAAVRDGAAALKEHGVALNDNGTARKGHAVAADAENTALEKVRTTALQSIVANFELNGSAKELTAGVAAAHGEFVNMATRMGMSKTEAAALADKLGLTQANVIQLAEAAKNNPVNVKITGIPEGLSAVDNLRARLASLADRNITVSVNQRGRIAALGIASGGYVSGPGSGTSDSIPANLSNGEYVQQTKAVNKYGVKFMDDVNSMRFAAGGYAGRSQSSSAPAPYGGPAVQLTVERVIQATPQDIAREVSWVLAGRL